MTPLNLAALALALLAALPVPARPAWAQQPAFAQPSALRQQQQLFVVPPELLGQSAAAAEGPPAPGATAASREAARALGDVIGIDTQVDAALARIHRDLLDRVIQRTGKDVDVASPIVERLLMPGFTAQRAELKAALLEPWASNFTAGDLRLLRSFFASPLGGRYLRLRPAIDREAAAAADQWSRRVFRDTTERNSIELEALGLRF